MSDTIPSLNDMCHALELEAVAERINASSRYTLEEGRKLEVRAGRHHYQFRTKKEIDAADDTPCTLKHEGESLECSFSATDTPHTVHVITLVDLGETVPQALLHFDPFQFFAKLKETLTDILALPITVRFNGALGNVALTGKPVLQQEPLELDGPTDLDSREHAAFHAALRHQATFLWTPPGTRSYRTLAAIVDALTASGKTVLIVSRRARNLDRLFATVCEELCKTQPHLIDDGLVVRRGAMVDAPSANRWVSSIEFSSLVAQREADSHRERISLLEERRKLEPQLSELERRERDSIWAGGVKRVLETARKKLKQVRAQHHSIQERVRALNESIPSIETKTLWVKKLLGALGRFSHPLVAPLEHKLRTKRGLLAKSRREALEQGARILELKAQCSNLDEVFRTLSGDPGESYSHSLKGTRAEFVRVTSAIDDVNLRLDRIQRSLLASARVVGVTTSYSVMNPVREQFDTVIFEDAAGVPLPIVYSLCGAARSSVVFAGDFMQSGSAASSRDPFVQTSYGADIFATVGVTDAWEQFESAPNFIKLTNAPLLPSAITSLTNDRWYRGEVTGSADNCQKPSWMYDSPVVIVDTSSLAPTHSSGSNPVHAAVVRHIAALIKSRKDPHSAVVTALYGKQIHTISRLLKHSEIYTVDVSELTGRGISCDTVVIDTVDAPSSPLSSTLRAEHVFDDGARTLHAALTAGMKQVVIVSNLSYLESRLSPTHLMQHVLVEARSKGVVVDAKELLTQHIVTSEELPEASSVSLGALTPQIFGANEFLSAFIADLECATESISLVAPTCNCVPEDRLVETLRERIECGVKVRVISRPPKENGSLQKLANVKGLRTLTEVDCEVWTRSKTSERIAIIDKDLFWSGALNPFSTTQKEGAVMVRCIGEELCEEAQKLFTDRNLKPFLRISEGPSPAEAPPYSDSITAAHL